MASKTALNTGNLEELGASCLAELLIEVTRGNAQAKRRLRLQLQLQHNHRAAIRDLRKRLATLARSDSSLDARKGRGIHEELTGLIRFIVEGLARIDAAEGHDLLWRIHDLSDWINARMIYRYAGTLDAHSAAREALEQLTVDGKVPQSEIAVKVFDYLVKKDFAQDDDLLHMLGRILRREGFEMLGERISSRMLEQDDKRLLKKREGRFLATPAPADARVMMKQGPRAWLFHIAELETDADAYISLVDESDRRKPLFSRGISRILLKAGRVDEAWKFIEQTEGNPLEDRAIDYDWADVRIDALAALGRADEAQAVRLHCFKRELRADYLRAYLENLPGFEDIEAEEKWLDYAMDHPFPRQTLSFLVHWPARTRANRLILRLGRKLVGFSPRLLQDAAECMETHYPLAATLAYRALIEEILAEIPGWFKDAVRCFNECAGMEAGIEDYGEHETHEEFVSRLRVSYWREGRFWKLVRT